MLCICFNYQQKSKMKLIFKIFLTILKSDIKIIFNLKYLKMNNCVRHRGGAFLSVFPSVCLSLSLVLSFSLKFFSQIWIHLNSRKWTTTESKFKCINIYSSHSKGQIWACKNLIYVFSVKLSLIPVVGHFAQNAPVQRVKRNSKAFLCYWVFLRIE